MEFKFQRPGAGENHTTTLVSISEIITDKKLTYTWKTTKCPNFQESAVRRTLAPAENGRTKVTLVDLGFMKSKT
jgi:hypothetical protein